MLTPEYTAISRWQERLTQVKKLLWRHPLYLVNVYFHYSTSRCWIYKYPTDRSWIFLISNRQSVGYSNIQLGIKQRKLKKCWNVYFQHKSKFIKQNFVIHKCISDKPRINFLQKYLLFLILIDSGSHINHFHKLLDFLFEPWTISLLLISLTI